MEPTLGDGDWLLVDPHAYRAGPPRVGDLVVAAGEPWLVKRIAAIDEGGALTLRGDHRAHAEDAVRIGGEAIRGRPWFRYRPLRRLGRVR